MKNVVLKIKNIVGVIPSFFVLVKGAILKNFIVFVLIATLVSLGAIFGLKKDGSIYSGQTRFILKEKSSSAGMGSLLGSFGFGSQGKENFDRILEFVKTQRLQQEILLHQYVTQDSLACLGDELVKMYELQEDLVSVGAEGFVFANYNPDNTNSETFKKAAFKVGKTLTGSLDGPGLLTMEYDRKSFIINMSAQTANEDLSVAVLDATYQKLENFYSNEISGGQSNDLNILTAKRDSIQRLVRSKEVALGQAKDKSRGLVLNADRTGEGRLMVEIPMLYELLGELEKNKAMAEYGVLTSDKGFLLLDEPIRPLIVGSRSITKVIIFSIALGLILASLFVFLMQIFRNPDLLDSVSNES
jgi:hypothetical protein